MKILWLAFALPILLLSCASPQQSATGKDPSDGWLKGTLTCLEDGSVYSFRIQKRLAVGGSATGGVVAIHPDGTRFSGQYTGIMNNARANSWGQASAWGSGGYAHATGTGTTVWSDGTANAQASMTATNGGAIQLRMTIRAGWVPHGMGEGRDNKGRTYQLLF